MAKIKMAKKDKAFELFNQGKNPDDPELKDLELKRATVKKYYARWLRGSEPAPALRAAPRRVKKGVSAEVPVGSLQPRQLFNFQGFEYRLNFIKGDQAHVLLIEWHPSGQYQIEECGRYLSIDTLVMPKAT